MKKTLLALAAIAASSAAFAQSSVTLYGVVDVSVESVRGDNTADPRFLRQSQFLSRIGFKGSEDLGGGARANFMPWKLNVKPDTGARKATGHFWDRQLPGSACRVASVICAWAASTTSDR
ncbi:MAG: porin [Aquabacterium sp.]